MISKKDLLETMDQHLQIAGTGRLSWLTLYEWAKSLPDDQPDLLPFQWPIPDGMEVVTRDGRKVEQLVMMDGITDPLLGVVDGVLHRWDKSGSMGNIHVGNDLFLRRKEKKVWVVEWETGPGFKYTVIDSEETAKGVAKKSTNSCKIYEATLKPFV